MKLFFVKGSKGEDPIFQRAGVDRVLFSFAYSRDCWFGEGYRETLVDSGGFTIRKSGGEIDPLEYAAYLRHYNVPFAFNLDTMDPDETAENQILLEEKTDTYIIPIYHLPSWLDDDLRGLLGPMVEKYPYIALGGVVGSSRRRDVRHGFFDYVFRRTGTRVRVHGLGVTSTGIVKKYPFYSVDSTSWITTKFGQWLKPSRLKEYYGKLRLAKPDLREATENNYLNVLDYLEMER